MAYFIIGLGVREAEIERYVVHGVRLPIGACASLAPSVADDYQNRGLGSLMMRHVVTVCRVRGQRAMILSGGTQATNARAIHFYEKHGFRKVGEFPAGGMNNFDMILDLC